MKYSVVVLATAASLAAAVSPADFFPSCALPALQKATASTSCSATDYACQCTTDNQNKIQTAATADVVAACGTDVAINQVLPAAAKFCAAVASSPASSSAASSSSSSAAATTAATGSSSAAASTTKGSTSAAATTTKEASTMTTKATGTGAPTKAGNGTATTTGVPVTAGAALAGSVGTLAMAVLGALAAF